MESTTTTGGNTCPACGPWWRLPVLLALVLVAIVVMRSRGVREETPRVVSETPGTGSAVVADGAEVVTLTIDSGSGQEPHTVAVAWNDGMTVGDVLAVASQLPDGFRFEKQGTGEMTLLTRIGDVANEGAGGRNWIYSVNGERGDRSYFIYPLQAGDRVLWEFTGQQ